MSRRVGLQTWGSDGDILPFLSLAKGLVAEGFEVTAVCTSVDGKDYTEVGLINNFKVIMVNSDLPTDRDLYALTPFPDPFLQLRALLNHAYEPLVDDMYAASELLCQQNDLVIGHALCHTLLTASLKNSINLKKIPLILNNSSYITHKNHL